MLEEGGHIAEVLHKPSGISPLWIPQWTPSSRPISIPDVIPIFGDGPDAKLLAGIMGHNLCLDIFGGPSAEEADAGLTAHGEASIARYTVAASDSQVTMEAVLAMAALACGARSRCTTTPCAWSNQSRISRVAIVRLAGPSM